MLINAGTNIKDMYKIVATITKRHVILGATHVHPNHTVTSIDVFPEVFNNPADTGIFRNLCQNTKNLSHT